MQIEDTKRGVLRKWLFGSALAAVALVLSACGGAGGGASVTVQLATPAIDMVLGSSQTVEVNLTRSAGATAAVSLTASGAPEWVTVDFSPVVLTGSNLQSTMTVTTDAGHPDAEPSALDLTVEAVGAGLAGQATLSVAVSLQDVTGTVIDGFGEPVAGTTVLATGKTAVVTGADGAFTFSGMSVPYDLTVVDTGESLAHRFVGLTTATPLLHPVFALVTGLTGQYSATINGTLTHPTQVPLLADHAVKVCVEALNGLALGCHTSTTDGDTTYDIIVNWSAPTDINVRVRGYIYQVDAEGAATAIVASGTAGPTVLSDGDAAVLGMTLSDSSSQASMSVTTSTPSGYTLQARDLVTHHDEFASFGFSSGNPAGDSDTDIVVAPFFTGASLTAFAVAMSNDPASSSTSIGWSTGHASGDSTTLTLPVPPTAISPSEATTGVSTATEFSVANPAGGVVTFVIQPATPGAGPVYAVTTAGTSAKLPDLAALGMVLPGSADYTWAALASASLPTVDAAVTGDGYFGGYVNLLFATNGAGTSPESDGQISTSNAVMFTTQ